MIAKQYIISILQNLFVVTYSFNDLIAYKQSDGATIQIEIFAIIKILYSSSSFQWFNSLQTIILRPFNQKSLYQKLDDNAIIRFYNNEMDQKALIQIEK